MSKKEEKEEKVASGDGDLFSYIKAPNSYASTGSQIPETPKSKFAILELTIVTSILEILGD